MKEQIKNRTKQLALDCWNLCGFLPNSREYNNYVRQLLRSSSSVGANYRAAQRAKSSADFINKLKIAEEEADETMYWLELLLEICDTKHLAEIKRLHKETNELLSILVASINTAKRNKVKK